MPTTPYERRLLITLIVLAAAALPVIIGGRLAMDHIRTSPTRWVPATFEKRQEYDAFERKFETNDAVVISWDGCTLDDPRLERLRRRLAEPDDSDEGKLIRRWVLRAFTGASLIDEMSDIDPDRLSRETIRKRLEGSLVSPHEDPDLKDTTCCVVLLTPEGVYERKELVPLLAQIAADKTGLSIYDPSVADRLLQVVGIRGAAPASGEAELRLVGPIVDAYMIDKESVESMQIFVIPSGLIVLLVCRLCLRSWPFTFVVFGIAVFGQLLTLALVYYSGETMNAVLIVMPPLVMVLTVSAAVHLVNYYHDEVRRNGLEGAPRRALRNGLLPCALATGTTAIGLLSLSLSDIVPVRLFGIYATAGIVTTLVLLFLTLPGAQQRWPVVARERREGFFKDLSGVANFCCRYPTAIVLAGLTLMAVCGWGLQWMRTSVNVRALFAPQSRILADYRWFEEHIGPMVPVELVLHFEPDDGRSPIQRLEIVDEIQWSLGRIEGVAGTMSAATFAPPVPRGTIDRRMFNVMLERNLQRFDAINYFKQTEHEDVWRVSGRVKALDGKDYGEFLEEIEGQIDPRLWAVHHVRPIRSAFADKNRRELGRLKVLLVGGPLAEVLQRRAAEEQPSAAALPPAAATEVFLEELVYLLEEDGFAAKNMAAFSPAMSREELADFDAVVLVADVPGVDPQALGAPEAPLFDARVHSQAALGSAADPRSARATYTGVMPLAYEVQRVLLQDLIKSFLAAVALVSVVMMVLQRSAYAGLVAMVPNVFPMVVLFGITSWRGMPIDIGTVMTASVALGIAVDDTLHYLTWFNREHSETGDNIAAVKLAFRHCAKAMLQTTLICSLGLIIYTFSWFMPTRRFSWMMVTLLAAAVVGDLVVLPAILASPLGRWFPMRKLIGDPLAKSGMPKPAEKVETGRMMTG